MTTTTHKPYVSSTTSMAEFTPKAVVLGILFGILFGATTSYLALKVGLTVSASIPIAVLAISLFKKFSQSTILENNIVQTIGSAGESIAAGVAFTLPALLFLSQGSEYFNYLQIFLLGLTGGLLGVLFMIPLRRSLIVQEHAKLPYPEGTACADILIAGEKGGSLAHQVYSGIGIAVVYKTLMSIFGLWKEIPEYVFGKRSVLPNAALSAEISPELLGVGYIIGIRASGIMVAGGILSSFVLIPLVSFFGEHVTTVLAPATKTISEMSPNEIWSKYIRYIGAGAVTFGGLVTMFRTIPTMISTVRDTFNNFEFSKNNQVDRVEQDIPITFVVLGSIFLVFSMAIIPQIPATWFSSLLILVAGFFFVAVSARIVGLIGSSSNPVSGMTIATLMGTSLIFILQGWTDDLYQPIALCVGAIVAIAAANAGATSQDLKTGFLIGATPIKQQIGIMLGVVASSCAVGFTIMLLYQYIGFGEVTPEHQHPLPAPQAMLMSTIVKGLFNQSLPWDLVLIGMGIAAVMELCGVNSLAFAVGTYLPLGTTAPMFVGGLISWFVNRRKVIKAEDADLEAGTLFSSGLIAGGAITGIVVALLLGTMIKQSDGSMISAMDTVNTNLLNTRYSDLGVYGDLISFGIFLILGLILYRFAMKPTR